MSTLYCHQTLIIKKSSYINVISIFQVIKTSKRHIGVRQSHVCPFCEKEISCFAKHILRVHTNEPEVRAINKIPKVGKAESRERRVMLDVLRKRGAQILMAKGIISAVRRPKEVKPDSRFLTCPHCTGIYGAKTYRKHIKTCILKTDEYKTKRWAATAMSVITNNKFLRKNEINKQLHDIVFQRAKEDAISEIVMNDQLIVCYGERLLKKTFQEHHRKVISVRMRALGRLLRTLKVINPIITQLQDVLDPHYFHDVVSAAKIESGFDEKSKTFHASSYALHIAGYLRDICLLATDIVNTNSPGVIVENAE